jgi:hypothetical protein
MKSYGRAWTKNCASIPESCVFNNALSISYEKEYIYRRSGWRSSHFTRPNIWDKWWVYIWVFKEEKSVCVHKRQARTTTTSAAVATQSCGRSQIAKKSRIVQSISFVEAQFLAFPCQTVLLCSWRTPLSIARVLSRRTQLRFTLCCSSSELVLPGSVCSKASSLQSTVIFTLTDQ